MDVDSPKFTWCVSYRCKTESGPQSTAPLPFTKSHFKPPDVYLDGPTRVRDQTSFSFLECVLGRSRTEDEERCVLSLGTCMEAGFASVSLAVISLACSTESGMWKVLSI